MRWIFFSLIFLNILFAGWQVSNLLADKGGQVESVVPLGVSTVPRITLLEEDKVKLKAVKSKPKKVTKPEPVKLGAQSVKESLESISLEDNALEDKVLEFDQVSLFVEVEKQGRCVVFGPFSDNDQHAKFIGSLKNSGIDSFGYEENVRKVSLFSVIVSPQASFEAADLLVDKLKAKQIDSSLITDGELLNGLSLGEFKNKDDAAKQVVRLTELDVVANIINKSESYADFWVKLNQQESSETSKDLLKSLQDSFPNAQRHEKVSKPVAS